VQDRNYIVRWKKKLDPSRGGSSFERRYLMHGRFFIVHKLRKPMPAREGSNFERCYIMHERFFHAHRQGKPMPVREGSNFRKPCIACGRIFIVLRQVRPMNPAAGMDSWMAFAAHAHLNPGDWISDIEGKVMRNGQGQWLVTGNVPVLRCASHESRRQGNH
jgi:hypothetical protein